jgi:hypothetical protein
MFKVFFYNVQNILVFYLVQKYLNMVKHIPAQSEISYTCTTEGDILVLEASCSMVHKNKTW